MRINKKTITILILIIIIIPICYVVISGYLHDLEEKRFYDTIKNVSDIENKSDAENFEIAQQSTATVSDLSEFSNRSINTINTEVEMLEDLKSKVSNESYKEYLDIQLNRLHNENRSDTIMLERYDYYNQYKNGKMSYSRALSLIEDKNEEIKTYDETVSKYKVESDTFLNQHKDMKDKFNQLGIDEDFMYEEIQDVKIKNVY